MQVADAAPSPAPGREGPSLLLGQLREVEARRAAAQAAQGGDAFDALTELAMLALDARWAGRDALQHVLRAASKVQRRAPAGDVRALLKATLPELAEGSPAAAAARALVNAAE
ncbi:MAG: hypothetical protein IPM35_04675 [Myxococcales bacterium]|nr:hypothetical protein [Myxococcales bacterium]